jgi:hypothetical protein
LDEVHGYKHLFINKYPKLAKLDNEEITEVDREIALRFMSNTEENQNLENSNEQKNLTLQQNKIIDKKVFIEKIEHNQVKSESQSSQNTSTLKDLIKAKSGSSHPLKKIILKKTELNKNNPMKNEYGYLHQIDQLKKELSEVLSEKHKLIKINKNYEMEANSLKIELENISNLNQEYERIIEDHKKEKSRIESVNNSEKLLQEVELWKREYFDLLNKNMNSQNTNINFAANNDFSMNASSTFFNEMFPKRPMSSYQVSLNKNLNEENFLNSSTSINKLKNSLDDSLNNSYEEIIEGNININNIQSNTFQDEEDEEIEDLLRKSTSNLKSLQDEIK